MLAGDFQQHFLNLFPIFVAVRETPPYVFLGRDRHRHLDQVDNARNRQDDVG